MSIALLLLLQLTQVVEAKEKIRIGVIDTGLSLSDPAFKGVLCSSGHADVTGTGIEDREGHGTHIAATIRDRLKKYEGRYCLVIIKFYEKPAVGADEVAATVSATEYAASLKLDYVNISAGGFGRNARERRAIARAPKTRWIVAAGNEQTDLNKKCNYFPACHRLPNMVAVGALDGGKVAKFSNYGDAVGAWEEGTVTAQCGINKHCIMSGTSQATAVHTARVVRSRLESERK